MVHHMTCASLLQMGFSCFKRSLLILPALLVLLSVNHHEFLKVTVCYSFHSRIRLPSISLLRAQTPPFLTQTPSYITQTPSYLTQTLSYLIQTPSYLTQSPSYLTQSPSYLTQTPAPPISLRPPPSQLRLPAISLQGWRTQFFCGCICHVTSHVT